MLLAYSHLQIVQTCKTLRPDNAKTGRDALGQCGLIAWGHMQTVLRERRYVRKEVHKSRIVLECLLFERFHIKLQVGIATREVG